MAQDGFYLIADHDPRGRCYTMHWFDSVGIEHDPPGLGSWESDTLTLVHETRHTGSSRYTYVVGDGENSMRLEHSPDGRNRTTVLQVSLSESRLASRQRVGRAENLRIRQRTLDLKH